MGIGIVLLFWAIAGCFLAAVAAVGLSGLTGYLTRGKEGSGKIVTATLTYPFISLAWVAATFFISAVVNVGFLDRDPGIGDSWDCPLPNGYHLLAIDDPDYGVVYNPKTQQTSHVVADKEDAISGVRMVQVSGRFIFGGIDNDAFASSAAGNPHIDSYFVLDTATNKKLEVKAYESLVTEAEKRGIKLELKRFSRVYWRYYFSWFDVMAGLLSLGPPVWGFVVLMRRTLKVRKEGRTAEFALQAN